MPTAWVHLPPRPLAVPAAWGGKCGGTGACHVWPGRRWGRAAGASHHAVHLACRVLLRAFIAASRRMVSWHGAISGGVLRLYGAQDDDRTRQALAACPGERFDGAGHVLHERYPFAARDHRCGVGCSYCLLWLMGQNGSRGRIGHALRMDAKDEREGVCKG